MLENKEILKKLKENIDEILQLKGIKFDKFDELRKKLLAEMKEKEKRLLAEEIAKEYQKIIEAFLEKKLKEIEGLNQRDKEKIVEAIRGIKIEPKINVQVPEIKVPEVIVPEIEIPEIKVPQPKVEVKPPEIKIPKTEFPKTFEIKGFSDYAKTLFSLLKRKRKSYDRDNPLPTILVDEKGRYIMPFVASGGGAVSDKRVFYKIETAKIAASGLGANVIVSAVAGKKIRVVSYFLVSKGEVNVKWQSGTTDISGEMAFVANTGIASPAASPPEFLMETREGENLVLNLSAAIYVGGHLSYFVE